MKLLVLAGGFGTRLRSVVADVPKPMAPVSDMPFLQFQIDNWINQGASEFVFLLHHQADLIIEFLKSLRHKLSSKYIFDWIVEPTPMDTGGAIAYAIDKLHLNDDFSVVNADTWLGGGVAEFLHIHEPAIAVINLPDVSRYGQIFFDNSGTVLSFSEKSARSVSGWINAGLYHLPVNLFTDWNGHPFSLERDLFDSLVRERKLKAIPLTTEFLDIGIPEDYRRFCAWVESGRKAPL